MGRQPGTHPNKADETWRDFSACFGADPDIFFPNVTDHGAKNRSTLRYVATVQERYCFNCPVMGECFDYAIKTRAEGIWGGMFFSSSTARNSGRWLTEKRGELLAQAVEFRQAKTGDTTAA